LLRDIFFLELLVSSAGYCANNDLVLADFSLETTKRVHRLLPPLAIRSNPIDMGPAWYDTETIKKVIEVVLADENIDGVLLYSAYASANRSLLNEITSLLKSDTRVKPIISCFPSPTGVWVEEKQEFVRSRVVFYPTPERAAKVMGSLVKQAYNEAKN
jgi:acyl-CoA synthetase (NDP forming)